MAKPKKDETSEDAKKIVDDAKNFIEKAIADIGKTSATKQLILGTASGWYAILSHRFCLLYCRDITYTYMIYKFKYYSHLLF